MAKKLPGWLKVLIEVGIGWLKKKGHIDPNAQQAPKPPVR